MSSEYYECTYAVQEGIAYSMTFYTLYLLLPIHYLQTSLEMNCDLEMVHVKGKSSWQTNIFQ